MILPVNRADNGTNIKFGRKLYPNELPVYTKTLNEGLKVLNKEVGIIIHNSSVPSTAGKNPGIGSLLSEAAESFFVPFLRNHAVTTIQQDPIFIRRASDPSPYDPLSTSKNIYMIPLEKLADEEYGNILTKETLKRLYKNQYDTKTNYPKVMENYNRILKQAYNNFTQTKNDKKITSLTKEFEEFKKLNSEELVPNAIYEILTEQNKEEDWKLWPEIDQNLYDTKEGLEKLRNLLDTQKEKIDFHLFKQWIVEREIAESNKTNSENGIRVIADTPIAFTPAEEWLRKDLFIKDFDLGCPPDYFSKEGQRWGFAVLRPDLMFNPDGTLGKAGEFLKQRYEKIFKDSPGGVRIDHLIGLIDPFVYAPDEPHMTPENSGRLYSSPYHERLKKYTKHSDDEYAAIFERIIFPAAEKYGITKDKIICEDLGEVTEPTRRIIDRLQLTGLSVTQFGYSGADAPERNVIMPGSHDNRSYIEHTNNFFNNAYDPNGGRDSFLHKTHILGSDTVIPNQDVNQYREEIRSSKLKFMAASFAELFTSPAKKVQVFFTDFFGIGKTYNIPGTKKDCWTLRLGSDYENLYYDNLAKGLGLNLPEAISTAIKHKGEQFMFEHRELLARLDSFTKILKS